MKAACLGNITTDVSVYKDGFIEEDRRNNFEGFNISPGGPASNAAYLLSKYGNNVDLYGQIGNDINGQIIYQQMQQENLNVKHISVSNNVMTPYSFIINNNLKSSRTICAVRSEKDYNNATIEKIEYENDYDYILIDGKYPEESMILLCKNPSATSIIDAGRVSDEMLLLCNYADYIVCSEDFANKVLGKTISYDIEKDKIIYQELKDYFPFAEKLVITIGGHGYICEKDDEIINMPAYESCYKTVDTSGAGDIFHGAFVHALGNGYTFYDALEFANVTASLSTTKRGGRYSVPELEEVENILKENKIKKKEKRL